MMLKPTWTFYVTFYVLSLPSAMSVVPEDQATANYVVVQIAPSPMSLFSVEIESIDLLTPDNHRPRVS